MFSVWLKWVWWECLMIAYKSWKKKFFWFEVAPVTGWQIGLALKIIDPFDFLTCSRDSPHHKTQEKASGGWPTFQKKSPAMLLWCRISTVEIVSVTWVQRPISGQLPVWASNRKLTIEPVGSGDRTPYTLKVSSKSISGCPSNMYLTHKMNAIISANISANQKRRSDRNTRKKASRNFKKP